MTVLVFIAVASYHSLDQLQGLARQHYPGKTGPWNGTRLDDDVEILAKGIVKLFGFVMPWHNTEMKNDTDSPYKGFRFPPSIIQYAVWLYFTFPLSYRDVELMLTQRGIQVSHETIRTWSYRFGKQFADQIRQYRCKPSDKWHLDEVFVTMNHRRYYLWRKVDSTGMVLDILGRSDAMPRLLNGFSRRFWQAQGINHEPL